MDRNFVIYIKCTSNINAAEEFKVLDRIESLTQSEVQAVLISAKKQLAAGGYTIIHYCDELGEFHASKSTHTIYFTPICYHNAI